MLSPTFYASFAKYYEAIFPFSLQVYAFLHNAIPSHSGTCIDIGCGTGHYAAQLAKDGVQVFAVDLDDKMIDYARQHYPHITVDSVDMRAVATFPDLFGVSAFDAAYCIGNTAAHLPQADFAQFVNDTAHILKPGATWILQMMNWDYVLGHKSFTFPIIEAENDIIFHRQYRDISELTLTFYTYLQAEEKIIFEDVVPLYPMRSAAIIQIHKKAGFTLRKHIASYAGAPFDVNTFSANIFVFDSGLST